MFTSSKARQDCQSVFYLRIRDSRGGDEEISSRRSRKMHCEKARINEGIGQNHWQRNVREGLECPCRPASPHPILQSVRSDESVIQFVSQF